VGVILKLRTKDASVIENEIKISKKNGAMNGDLI
tara:strand:- start:29 stop:130 length:102 start_codon:yes stop_codon:yes gene_type:complete